MTAAKRNRTDPALAALPSLILALLKREPLWSVEDLARELDFSTSAIRKRLLALQGESRVHHIKLRTAGGLGLVNLWQHGPAPKNPAAPVTSKPIRAHQVAQTVNTGDKNRDPLVAALFGPANGER